MAIPTMLLAAALVSFMAKTSSVCKGTGTQSGDNLECKLDKLSSMPGTQRASEQPRGLPPCKMILQKACDSLCLPQAWVC